MKKFVMVIFALLGWFFLAIQLYHQHERTEMVRLWTEAAYDTGYEDAAWYGPDCVAPELKKRNKQFAVDTVVKAHEGAWDKW